MSGIITTTNVSPDSEYETIEVTLDVRDFDQTLQRVIFISALEGVLERAVNALAERGISVNPDTVLELAGVLREKSAEHCWFCGEKNQHKTGWSYAPGVPHMTWSELGNVACPCLAEFRNTRKTLLPGWETRIQEIANKVVDGQMKPSTVLYIDKCISKGCGQLFKVTAKNAAVGFAAYGKFSGWSRCPTCVKKDRNRFAGNGEGARYKGKSELMIPIRRQSKNALLPTKTHSAAHGWTVEEAVRHSAERSKGLAQELKKRLREGGI